MPRELAIFDALVPGLLLIFIISVALLWALDHLFGRFGLYRHVWHPPLFRLAVFVCIFGALGLLAMR